MEEQWKIFILNDIKTMVFYFFATPLIDYSKLIELQAKEKSPSAFIGKKR